MSVPTAIDFQATHQWHTVRTRCRALLAYGRDQIGALTKQPAICPDSADWRMQMAVITLPPGADPQLSERLWAEDRIEIPVIPWGQQRFIRTSIQAYNTPAHLETLAAAMMRLLQ